MANDPTTWFNWDLPNDGGDRNTWGAILRDRWSDLDDMFGGKVMPNNKWLTISGATDRAIVLNTEYEASNRAAILFTDAADGVNSYAASQFEFRYFGGSTNEFRFQSRDGNIINKTHWRATGDLFRFENRIDIAIDRDAAICLSTENNSADVAEIVFTDTTPTGATLPTERRFGFVYDSAAQELKLNAYDGSGNLVATAFTVDSAGQFTVGDLGIDGDLVLESGGSVRDATSTLLIQSNGDIRGNNLLIQNTGSIRNLERTTETIVNPWPY